MPVKVPKTPVTTVVYEVGIGRAVSNNTVPSVPVTGSVTARVPVNVPGVPVRIVVYDVGKGRAV